MKLRYFALVTVVAALVTAACADSPTASRTSRAPSQLLRDGNDTTSLNTTGAGGGILGSGH